VIISVVSGIVNVMCLVIPVAAFFTYFVFCGSHYNSSVGSVKSKLQNVKSQSVCILEGTITRAPGISGYFPQLLKYHNFWSINCMLKELCCISEAPLDVLKVELLFIVGDLDFPTEQWFFFYRVRQK